MQVTLPLSQIVAQPPQKVAQLLKKQGIDLAKPYRYKPQPHSIVVEQ